MGNTFTGYRMTMMVSQCFSIHFLGDTRQAVESILFLPDLSNMSRASKADDEPLFREFNRQRHLNMITCCRSNMDMTPHRKKMIEFMRKPKHKKIYRERAYKVEPMQG